jgi:2-hydroxychromene-2-carboxylate isomerase
MSKLPSGIMSLFSDNEKQGFTTQQQNISNEEVVRQVRTEAGINDDRKAQQATEESVKLLQEKTGEEGLLDNVMGRFKKMDLNPFD